MMAFRLSKANLANGCGSPLPALGRFCGTPT